VALNAVRIENGLHVLGKADLWFAAGGQRKWKQAGQHQFLCDSHFNTPRLPEPVLGLTPGEDSQNRN
jgi:hypothetical protein